MKAQIELPTEKITAFCQRNQIVRLALFGSMLRDDFTPESDVDVLVEFAPEARVGLSLVTIQGGFSAILGRHVDQHAIKGANCNRGCLLLVEMLGSAEAFYDQSA